MLYSVELANQVANLSFASAKLQQFLETAKFFANFLSTFLFDSVFAAVYRWFRSDLRSGEGKIIQHRGRDCAVSHSKNGIG
jgi:ribonucleotide reductase beta subunit family protein with ferritin-like domain